jgi:tetratricopeptide (TPR) repeat protein
MADSPRIEELKRRVQMDPASIAFAALAEEFRRAERYDEAIETCTAGLVRHPAYLSAHVTLGRSLMEVGRLQEAQQELELVLKLAPENLAAIRGLAEIHRRLGDAHESHEFQPAPQSSPTPHSTREPQSAREPQPFEPPPPLSFSMPEPQMPASVAARSLPPDNGAVTALEHLLGAIQRVRADRTAVR